jgi:hypothetical protein
MTRFFADEDFPFPVVERLREMGHDVLTTADAGLAGVSTPDEDILAEATKDGRIVLTMNRRDYIALHNADANHGGIVVCTRDRNPEALAKRIDNAIAGSSVHSGLLFRVRRPGMP